MHFLVWGDVLVICLAQPFSSSTLESSVELCCNIADVSQYAQVDIPRASIEFPPFEAHLHVAILVPAILSSHVIICLSELNSGVELSSMGVSEQRKDAKGAG